MCRLSSSTPANTGLPRDEVVNVARLALLPDGPVNVLCRGLNHDVDDLGE